LASLYTVVTSNVKEFFKHLPRESREAENHVGDEPVHWRRYSRDVYPPGAGCTLTGAECTLTGAGCTLKALGVHCQALGVH
jgi:hypothetical protein